MSYIPNPVVAAETPYKVHEVPTKNGLSYSPAEMNQLTAEGRTTSLNAMQGSAYYDGGDINSEVPFECMRGVDVNDAFELERSTRRDFDEFKSQHHHFKGKEQSTEVSKGGE